MVFLFLVMDFIGFDFFIFQGNLMVNLRVGSHLFC